MRPDFFNDLKALLEKLPGIGPRQASRFVWAMLDFEPKERERLAGLISLLDQNLKRCSACFGAFHGDDVICSFCLPNSSRDHSKIMVLERDSDLLNVEKSRAYRGLYHILGNVFDPLEKNLDVKTKIRALYERVGGWKQKSENCEIILALSPTKIGEFTANYVEKTLEPLAKSRNVKISRLGRGLATGTDLEYADETTLRQALDNRK